MAPTGSSIFSASSSFTAHTTSRPPIRPITSDALTVTNAQGAVIAEVEGRELKAGEFRRRYQNQIQAYQGAYGGKVSAQLLRQLGVERQVLQQMIDEQAAIAEAERQGLRVSDEELAQQIFSIPAFQDKGRFVGEQRYEQVLRSQRPPITKGEFEESLRRSMLVDKLRAAVTDWMSISDAEIERGRAMSAGDWMKRGVFSCRPETDLNEAARLMWEHDCGCLPVLDAEGRVVGMVTDRDACMAAFMQRQPLQCVPVSVAMSKHVVTCRAEDTNRVVSRLMAKHKIRRIPVVDDEQRPVGIVSLDDLALAMAQGTIPSSEVGQTLAAISASPPTTTTSVASRTPADAAKLRKGVGSAGANNVATSLR